MRKPDRHILNSTEEIPCEALDVRSNSSGALPDVGIHKRGQLFYQESSYSHFWLLAIMMIAAIVVCMLPWSTKVDHGFKLKYVIAGMLVWGGICGGLAYWIRNWLGQTILIDPVELTVTIRQRQSLQVISWPDIVGLQVCRQKVPGNSSMNGYQLNLVWRDARGQIQRHCLLAHAIKKFVVSLGNQYASLFRFKLMDVTSSRPQTPAAQTKPSAARFLFSRVFPVPFILAGLAALYFSGRGLYYAHESRSWPSAAGTILSSGLEYQSNSDGPGTHHAAILYQFDVDGRTHSGKKVAFGDYGSSDPSHAQEIIDRYPKGKAVRVYYRSSDPDICVLELGLKGQAWLAPGIGLLFFVAGSLMAVLLPRAEWE